MYLQSEQHSLQGVKNDLAAERGLMVSIIRQTTYKITKLGEIIPKFIVKNVEIRNY